MQTQFLSTAACHARIDHKTAFAWLRKGKEQRESGLTTAYTIFADCVEAAENYAEQTLLYLALKAACKDGRLALEILARRYPEHWGRMVVLEKDKPDIVAELREMMRHPDFENQPILIGPECRPLHIGINTPISEIERGDTPR